MDAATLTAFRERHQCAENGDRAFLVECALGRYGKDARVAFETAETETADTGAGPDTEARMADRLIELANGAEPELVGAGVVTC